MSKIEEIRKRLMEQTKKQVQEKFSGDESNLIKAVSSIETIDELSNMIYEQAREWYALYFPELGRAVKEPEIYLRLAYELCKRENFTKGKIIELYKNEKKAEEIERLSKNSLGAEISEETLSEIKVLCLNALNLKEEKKYLANYTDILAKKIMPNISHIAGTMLAARLLAKAGSLKKLAIMPASAMQVLGADKAIFAHLRQGARSPKHGLIFHNPMISEAPRNERGRIARILSSKLAIAAKADYFSKNFIAEGLKKEMSKKLLMLK